MLRWAVRLLAMVAMVAAMAGVAGETLAQELISRLDFREAYAARLEKAIPGVKIVRKGEAELELTLPDGRTMTAFLDNAYMDYRKDPDGLDQLLERHARSVASATLERPLEASRIVVIVRHEAFVSSQMDLTQGAKTEEVKPLYRRLGGGLVAIVGQDEPESVFVPPRQDLIDRFGDEDKVWAMALANTSKVLGEVNVERLGDGTILLVTAAPSYAPSLLVLDRWNAEPLVDEGNPVVVVVDRDAIIVTRDRNPDNLLLLGRIMRGLRDDGTPALSDEILVLKSGEWIEVDVD
jgi:hypothetical protein